MHSTRASQVKTDSKGNVYYEAWTQPHGEGTRLSNVEESPAELPAEPRAEPRDVLTKPKILPIEIIWERVEEATNNKLKRYVLDAATYQRLRDAVKA